MRLSVNDPNLAYFTMAIHASLYQRLEAFCKQYTPEFPSDLIVKEWLRRLYQGDESLHILIEWDREKQAIYSHCVVEVSEMLGSRIVRCYQAQNDRNKKPQAIDDFMEYVEKLAESVGAICTIFDVQKHQKALEKYGFQIARTTMLKWSNQNEVEEA